MFNILLDAQPAAGASGGAGSMIQFLLFPVLLGVFWFFFIRPQQKRQEEDKKMRQSVQNGDKIITIGGLHEVVTKIDDTTITLKVEDGTKLVFEKDAIRTIVK